MIISCSPLIQYNIRNINKYVCFLFAQNTTYTRKGFNFSLNSNTLLIKIYKKSHMYRINQIGNSVFSIYKKTFEW